MKEFLVLQKKPEVYNLDINKHIGRAKTWDEEVYT